VVSIANTTFNGTLNVGALCTVDTLSVNTLATINSLNVLGLQKSKETADTPPIYLEPSNYTHFPTECSIQLYRTPPS
jgi:hypothetical protein